jgi:uncharacterized protein YodC (DUF2158 family)
MLNTIGAPQQNSSSQAEDQRDDRGPDLKIGTRGKLRAGGPLMAVESINGSEVTCVWFDDAGEAESGVFSAASLMQYP